MKLLALVAGELSNRGIPHALIGGIALAAHGVARGTLDADVLVLAPQALDESTWATVRAAGATVEVRHGDSDDPFRAVVRISAPNSWPVYVLVGRFDWQQEVIARAERKSLPIADIPVVGAADLVLLKIYAGGPQDLVDAQRLLAAPERERIVAAVESRLDALPADCRRVWERIKSAGD